MTPGQLETIMRGWEQSRTISSEGGEEAHRQAADYIIRWRKAPPVHGDRFAPFAGRDGCVCGVQAGQHADRPVMVSTVTPLGLNEDFDMFDPTRRLIWFPLCSHPSQRSTCST